MEIITDKPDLWTLVRDLIFKIPAPLLLGFEDLVALLILVVLLSCALRIWRGAEFTLGPLKIERGEALASLECALDQISKDDKLKANVLWMFRDRLNEATRIIRDGVNEPSVRTWCGELLTDVATALSRGGEDRHRSSLWVRDGEVLRMFNGIGFRQEAIDRATLPLASIAGNVWRTGTTYNSADVDNDRAFHPKPRSGRPYQSLLSVPVRAPSGITIAVLCVDAETRGYFDGDDEFFAGCFADLMTLLASQVLMEIHA